MRSGEDGGPIQTTKLGAPKDRTVRSISPRRGSKSLHGRTRSDSTALARCHAVHAAQVVTRRPTSANLPACCGPSRTPTAWLACSAQ
jgi:hypothetical protein